MREGGTWWGSSTAILVLSGAGCGWESRFLRRGLRLFVFDEGVMRSTESGSPTSVGAMGEESIGGCCDEWLIADS